MDTRTDLPGNVVPFRTSASAIVPRWDNCGFPARRRTAETNPWAVAAYLHALEHGYTPMEVGPAERARVREILNGDRDRGPQKGA